MDFTLPHMKKVTAAKTLLECVEIDKKPGLLQIIGPDGEPKRFQAKEKIVKS